MTADEVLEAMARGRRDMSLFQWERTPADLRAQWVAEEKKSIRALPPGWVVANVPGDEPICGSKDSAEQMLRAEGYNDALAAVRAEAVKVEGV